MALEIYHHGRLLTPRQLEVYSGLLTSGALEGLSIKRGKALFDKQLADLGIAVPALQPGDHVTWENKGVSDSGQITSIDDRAGKLRVMSAKKNREFTVPEAYVKVVEPVQEAVHG